MDNYAQRHDGEFRLKYGRTNGGGPHRFMESNGTPHLQVRLRKTAIVAAGLISHVPITKASEDLLPY